MSILGVLPHIVTYSFIWLRVSLLSCSRKPFRHHLASNPRHLAPPPQSGTSWASHCLWLQVTGQTRFSLAACAFCLRRDCLAALSRSRNRSRSLPGNKELLAVTCSGQGHVLLPRITRTRCGLYSFSLSLKTGLSPTRTQRTPCIKEVAEDQRMAKPCQNLMIDGT